MCKLTNPKIVCSKTWFCRVTGEMGVILFWWLNINLGESFWKIHTHRVSKRVLVSNLAKLLWFLAPDKAEYTWNLKLQVPISSQFTDMTTSVNIYYKLVLPVRPVFQQMLAPSVPVHVSPVTRVLTTVTSLPMRRLAKHSGQGLRSL